LGGGVVVAAPQIVERPQALSFREIVALFAEKREAGLHALLYGQVHLVRCEVGLLELRVSADAPANLAGRVGQCLTEWTGQRWVVSISPAEGAPSLIEQDREAETKHREHAREHPLMQAVFAAFPQAKLTALRQRAVAPTAANSDDAPHEHENNSPLNDSED
jgi:DNA polymerase-3 subunit gamma/tau